MAKSKRAASLKAKGAKNTGFKKSTRSAAQPGQGLKTGNSSSNPNREAKQSYHRDARTIRLLEMYKKKPKLQTTITDPNAQSVMIEPSRKWFNNTRVVSQTRLSEFREAMETRRNDPSTIVVKRTKLPVSLFTHHEETARAKRGHLLSLESYEETFSPNKRRKKPRLAVESIQDLASKVATETQEYDEEKLNKDQDIVVPDAEVERKGPVDAVMLKGTSKRIWGELYKVVDSSDVIVEVLDARDPLGTRCYHLEKHIKKDRPFKHVVLLLNKCDLIPTSVTERWVKLLKKEFPTIAFKASITKPFGKKAFIGLLRQFAQLLSNRKHVSVGFVGYPNVGKSSVINTMRAKKVCNTAPIPGETKIWQYVALTSKVYLIDCPGIVIASSKPDGRNDVGKVLKGVVRSEKIDQPEDYVGDIIDKVGKDKIKSHYKLEADWETPEDFLELLAIKMGKLKKGGEPEISVIARKIINDLQRGRLPYFIPPPSSKEASNALASNEQQEEALVLEQEAED
eukprot:Blabericola_migrator_1__2949@NODE_184_length_11839_cov_88_277438_g159_i0_p2_GENE_NODE_184_length_11839_cov_88_277438_g159_i0NODE_184_length_11839_cov_88_277438_g159_i0_p2_ORF_typecomplete_len511_score120_51NGP1NT/PF08153_12/8e33MMR_HSR1/PF01926_23/3_2e02MMR_HSR1/PF01926_23/2_9e14RsgA_GTPase/PF03193_16/1e11FeoB_N/PF02421_18/0_28FeoB_N/PF02421_18/1_8e06MnmE_helical/PF12631_7/2_8e03MnmE_helical/PF12631_7/0_00064IIGP/PF05049_13/0_0023GTP_EFTU/PF00009_27/0_28GTP_EFTU/PF00009_27/62AIG1/PF04548_16/1_5e